MKFTFTCPHCKNRQTKNLYIACHEAPKGSVHISINTGWYDYGFGGIESSIDGGNFKCPICRKEIDIDKEYSEKNK